MENDSRKSVPVMKECQTLNSGTPATPIPKYPNESISYQKYLEESEEYLSAFTQQTQPSTVWSAEKNYQPLYGKISIMSQSSEPQWYKLQSYLPHWDSRLAGRLNGGSTTSIFREWDSFQGSCQLINCSCRREKDSQKSVRTANAFPSGSSSTLAPPTPDQLRAVRNRFTSVKSSSSLYLSPSSLSMLAENHNLDKEGNNFIETNKTPQRNARRKRYQPKVLTEAESKQTLNLKTPISIETPRVEVPEEASKACKRALSFDMNDQARRDDSVHISNGDLNSQPEADNSSTANGHLSSNSSSDNGEQMRYSKRSRFCASVGNKEKTDLDATCSAFWQSKHMFLGNVNTNRIPSILFPEIYKKKRTEKGRWSYTSSTSSAAVSEDVSNETNPQNPSASEYYYCNPLHCNTKTRTVPNNQAKTALERTKTRIQLLQTWADIARTKKKRSKGPTRGCNFCPLRGISECPVKQRRKYAQRMKVDFQDNSVTCTGATVDVSNRPHSCVEALLEETKSTLRRKRRSKKQDNVFCSTSSNIHKMKMQLDLVLYGGDQSTRNSAGALLGLPWEVSIDTHTEGLKQLDIDRGRNIDSLQQQCALIPYHVKEQTALVYGKDGKMVPFEGPFSPVKKRHPRARVDLDDETSRVWKLLLESIDSKGIDGTDVENAKWWEQERGVFQGRVDSFIARMRLVQGDRRFTLWKGSIVDSVIGVFLTQNVADHLSSSAFMSMAARFPIKSENKHTLCSEVINALVKEQKIYILEPEHNIAYEKTTDQHICSKSSATLHDDEHSGENEVDNSKEVLGSSVGVSSECGNSQKVCNELRAHKANYYITKTEASSTGDDIARDNAASLQHSMLSSQNFVNSPSVQTVERMRLHSKSNSEAGELTNSSKQSKGMGKKDEQPVVDWDSLRKQAQSNGRRKRASNTIDSVDWEAVRCADVRKIADTIKERGMNNILADRIKDFLNRLVREHGAVDLEWLRDIPPDKAKEYLLSIRGLGLKSVECVRLLTLHHLAFPVDTNVGRIAVRLGWVPLQPLPESLQLHLLELYPILESIQKYLWPRLCKLDQKTLYELHYHMITFGKVFCTKRKPNCNACPLRGECRHFASAFASARLALPGPEEGSIVPFTEGIATHQHQPVTIDPLPLPPVLACQHSETNSGISRSYHVGEVQASALSLQEHYHSIPIVEVPESPELEYLNTLEQDIEDTFYEDPDEIPTIKLNMEEFTQTVQKYMQQNIELQAGCMSRALVALTPEAASIPTPKLKNVSRLRTEHHVYELPDKHPLLEGLDKREPDDPCSYLLAIWTPGETANCVQPPETRCNTQEPGLLCSEETCFQCNSQREANFYIVRGTLLIPCRTAMRGSFPLNGTYFQVNEVFADHDSSLSPIEVPREWLWNLARRTVYFGTSIQTIFKGLTTDEIQHCFWKGHVCVRGFDRKTRAPRPLMARLHLPASKMARARGTVNHPDATI